MWLFYVHKLSTLPDKKKMLVFIYLAFLDKTIFVMHNVRNIFYQDKFLSFFRRSWRLNDIFRTHKKVCYGFGCWKIFLKKIFKCRLSLLYTRPKKHPKGWLTGDFNLSRTELKLASLRKNENENPGLVYSNHAYTYWYNFNSK